MPLMFRCAFRIMMSSALVAVLMTASGVRSETVPAQVLTANPWVTPATYRFEPPVACIEAPERASLPQRPSDARYQVCADQMALFARGVEQARRDGKLLLVTFGATWCGWCATLQKQLPGSDLLGPKDGATDLGRAFHHIEIGVSTLHKGRQIAMPSGERVLTMVLTHSPGARLRAVPFLAIVDPASTDRVVVRNLDDLAIPSRGTFDAARTRDTLRRSHAYITTGASAPDEPGWLKRKLVRWWYGP